MIDCEFGRIRNLQKPVTLYSVAGFVLFILRHFSFIGNAKI